MKRKEKEVTDPGEIESILRNAPICHLGLCDDGQPYVIPLCFGFQGKILYFHCAREGRKLDILRRNNRACAAFVRGHHLRTGEDPCAFGMGYESALAFGEIETVDDPAERGRALDRIMAHYDPRFAAPGAYGPKSLSATVILRMSIRRITGKRS